MLRLLVTGSRDWIDEKLVIDMIVDYWKANGSPDDFTIVHGGCSTGADNAATLAAMYNLFNLEIHPADWQLGRRAGPLRNKEMVDTKPDACYAFIRNNSRGASNCAKLAQDAGIPTVIWRD